jgi:hypothetical protein
MGELMPRTLIRIGGTGSLLRAARCGADLRVELVREMIEIEAARARSGPWVPRARLVEFGAEGERGPPA